jgi:hypothetical protein
LRTFETALDDAIAFAVENGTAFRPAYGFILRSKEPSRTNEVSDVLFESPLLGKIRRLVYDVALPPASDVPVEKRHEFLAVHACLTGQHATFQALFPRWKAYVRRFNTVLARLRNGILTLCAAQSDPLGGERWKRAGYPALMRPLAEAHLRYIQEKHPRWRGGSTQEAASLVDDFIRCPNYAASYVGYVAP